MVKKKKEKLYNSKTFRIV